MKLKDKIAIITGGSRGIGYATAEKFLREGAHIAISASTQENAEKAAAKLREIFPNSRVLAISPDLTSLESVKEAFQTVVEAFGRLDILVNNAGVSERTPFVQYTEETFDKVMDLNVKGAQGVSLSP